MTRSEALQRLAAFGARIPQYAADRNVVLPGHKNVSQLSPAIRHRLITEEEVADFAIREHGFKGAEKFVQEVYWRLYWKSWLEQRPQVWSSYTRDLDTLPSDTWTEADKLMSGHSGIAILDHFAQELVSTGYMHNHARMWFAAAWIHHFKMPWQVGADFFQDYLLDGDPASNTLSWRWVAGLHTAGKCYLARSSNIRKNVDPALLEFRRDGLEELDSPTEHMPEEPTNWERSDPEMPIVWVNDLEQPAGLWIHEDDLTPELCEELRDFPLQIALALISDDIHDKEGYSDARRELIRSGLEDAAERWRGTCDVASTQDTAETLLHWAQTHGLRSIVTLAPWVGPMKDALPLIRKTLAARDITLHLHRRESDGWWLPLATGGFFKFWQQVQKQRGFHSAAR